MGDLTTCSPLSVRQPPSPDEANGDQLEGDSQVAQTLSLEHVRASNAALKCPMLIHPPRLDKFYARFWIWIWGRLLDPSEPPTQTAQVVFCISCMRRMSSMGVRILGYSNVVNTECLGHVLRSVICPSSLVCVTVISHSLPRPSLSSAIPIPGL